MLSCTHEKNRWKHRISCGHFSKWLSDTECSGCPFYSAVPERSEAPEGSNLSLPPLTTTTRHCIGHLWPNKSNPMWWKNLDNLLRRIELFNGRRILSVSLCEKTVTRGEVEDYLRGHGFEYHYHTNSPKFQEHTTTGLLRSLLADTEYDPSAAVFYWHGKGTGRYADPAKQSSVEYWASTMWSLNTDYWPLVKNLLNSRGAVGAFLRPWPNTGTGHFSGTFFWVRSYALQGRKWQRFKKKYGGIEEWPGRVFTWSELGCIFGESRDNPLSLYDPESWKVLLPLIEGFKASHQTL